MKVLCIDIETAPSTADIWRMFKVNVSLNQLRSSGGVICFAAKWVGEKKMMFFSDFHDGHDVMVQKAWDLLDEADAIVHYNGTSFDIPHLRREFLLAGMAPPSPARDIDLLRTVRKQFRFISNKLDYVVGALDIGSKTHHEGHGLWTRCMAGDEAGWALMRKYNKNDVVVTEKLYNRLLPWVNNHPSVALYSASEEPTCERCGGTDMVRRGFAYTQLGAFQRFVCNGCGGWSRSGKRHHAVDLRGVA